MAFIFDWFRRLRLENTREWRTFPDNNGQWSDEHIDMLRLATFPQTTTIGKILLIGPIKSGKSSFINSVLSIHAGRPAQSAPVAAGGTSVTPAHNQFMCGNFLVCDMMGLEDRENVGFNMGDIEYLLKGNIPKDYKFNPLSPITEETDGFNKTPTHADRVHCVLFCIGADSVQNGVQLGYLKKWQELLDKINTLLIPRILILTKIDAICEDVRMDVSNTFKSKEVQQVVKKASELFNIPEMYIHPVKNFKENSHPKHNKNKSTCFLILHALQEVHFFAQDFIKNMGKDAKTAEQGNK